VALPVASGKISHAIDLAVVWLATFCGHPYREADQNNHGHYKSGENAIIHGTSTPLVTDQPQGHGSTFPQGGELSNRQIRSVSAEAASGAF
jgi:hypothetical protein